MNDLSPNNRLINILFPSVPLALVIYLVYGMDFAQVKFNFKVIETITVLIAIFLLLGFWLYFAFISPNLYYDSESLILKSFKYEKVVPLKNIKRLKLTLARAKIMGAYLLRYRIEYIDSDNKPDSVSFWTSLNSKNLDAFINLLGDETIVEQYASTFDN